MQCLRIWFTIGFCIIKLNNSVATPVDTLSVDDKNKVDDLNAAASKHNDAEIAERENEIGYLKSSNEKGGDGYQHFESFHDKDGDAYGYEKHEAFGKSNKGESLNDEEDTSDGSNYKYVQELGDKPKYQKYHNIDHPETGKQTNYHYSYNSDDDEPKPKHSLSYKEDTKKSDSSEEEDDEEDSSEEADNNGIDEERSTNFSYKLISDDDDEEDANNDVTFKGTGNGGYHFGHGDRNTDVTIQRKSDYTASDDDDDEDEDEGDDDESSEDDRKTDNNEGNNNKPKSFSTYTTYNSQEGDQEDDGADEDDKEVPKNAIRYEKSYPKKVSTFHKLKNDHERDDEEKVNNESKEQEDVEPHQPIFIPKPKPTKPAVLVKEHRAVYKIRPTIGKATPIKSQVIIQPTKPIVLVQEFRSGYKVEETDGVQKADDNGKGHGGSVSKHLYEIYVTHDAGKAKPADDGGGSSEDNEKEKIVSSLFQQLKEQNQTVPAKDKGGYNVNINYGQKKATPKHSSDKSTKKYKTNLKNKKKKFVRPHNYEVEEYIDGEKKTKEPIIGGKESAPQHHRDSGDYSYGQQFIFASEADSDAYY